MTQLRKIGVALAAFVALGAALPAHALSPEDDGDAAPAPKPVAMAPAPVPEAPKDIVAVAVAAGNFNTLAKALTAAGLVETLQGPGPFTVFAPTDEAFAKLPAGALDKLLANKAKLKKVLTYHVVAGKVMAADIVKVKEAKSLEGSELKIKVVKGKVTVDKAEVVKADIEASNGVIHAIDTVLMPRR